MSNGNLFKLGTFIAAGGDRLAWKIECDALTPEDWATIAKAMSDRIPPFGTVCGMLRGGTPLADAMRQYATHGNANVLVCDDVWTTGKSMRNFVGARNLEHWHGLVVFARGELDANIQCFMQHPVPPWLKKKPEPRLGMSNSELDWKQNQAETTRIKPESKDLPRPGDWRASRHVLGPNDSGYYTAGIDVYRDDRIMWHDHAIQIHDKDRGMALARRDVAMLANPTDRSIGRPDRPFMARASAFLREAHDALFKSGGNMSDGPFSGTNRTLSLIGLLEANLLAVTNAMARNKNRLAYRVKLLNDALDALRDISDSGNSSAMRERAKRCLSLIEPELD